MAKGAYSNNMRIQKIDILLHLFWFSLDGGLVTHKFSVIAYFRSIQELVENNEML